MKEKEKKEAQKRVKSFIEEKLETEGIENLSKVLEEAKNLYFDLIKPYVKDVEQSWKPFKGNIIEDIILKAIEKSIENVGFKVIKGSKLEKSNKLTKCLSKLKRLLCINYGEFGLHMPDCDLIIYTKDCKPLAIISSKATLRERVTQTAYWSIKLKMDKITKDIKILFITLDEDGDLAIKKPAKKGRAIAEIDIDRTYVIGKDNLEESEKVKKFESFHEDLKRLFKGV